MKLTIEKSRLSMSLAIIAKGMSSRTTLPILSSILLETSEGKLIFRTTDLETSISHQTEVLIEQEGATVVPGRLFSDIIKSLPEAAVNLEQTNEGLRITCMDSLFTIKTLNPSDFPLFPRVEEKNSVTLPAARFTSMVKKVTKAVSKDESRAVLTGVFVKAEEKTIQMVATDSYRLAIAKDTFDEPTEIPLAVIIPGTALDEVARLVAAESSVVVGETENQIIFTFSDTVYITRKIEGTYPNYEAIIPTEKSCSAVISTAALVAAVKRASIAAQAHTPIRCALSDLTQTIEISSQTADIASALEKTPAHIEGEPLEIGFNHQYFLDGLSSIDTEEVLFEAQNSLKPGILKTVGEGYFFYLTMPIRLNE